MVVFCFFFFKQKTAYEMRISDWSSDVCSSDLMERFDGYYGGATDIPPVGKACVDRVIFKMIPENASRVAALLAGDVHIIDALQVVYKVAERCNINCSYCYYFHMGDETPLERPAYAQIGRAHVGTPVTNAHLVCRLLLET